MTKPTRADTVHCSSAQLSWLRPGQVVADTGTLVTFVTSFHWRRRVSMTVSVPAVVEGHGDCTARAPSQSIMLGAGQGAAAGSNATHEVARKAVIGAGAGSGGAGSGGAETGAGSPSVRSPPSTAHASRECALPAPPAARAGTPAAGTSKQAQLAASFEAKSAQLLQQFVAFRSQRTLSTDDRCLGWGRKFVSPQPAAIRRFQCPFTPAAVRNIGCPPLPALLN